MKKCVFAGTFDPFTVGHRDTVEKCLKLFDEVLIAVAENPKKETMFSSSERLEMIRAAFEGETHVKEIVWKGAIVDLLQREQTPFYVRGLRNTTDFEYENADFFASRDFDKDMITLYIPSEQDKIHISSTLVKNCIAFHKPYREYLPEAVYDYIQTLGKGGIRGEF